MQQIKKTPIRPGEFSAKDKNYRKRGAPETRAAFVPSHVGNHARECEYVHLKCSERAQEINRKPQRIPMRKVLHMNKADQCKPHRDSK